MKAVEIRKKYLEFFKSKNHQIIPSALLVPENDPTVLFTTAGMHPLVPYLMGEKHPLGKRLTNVQKCVRTDDIEEVGDRTHHTFFEMLGNWSLGDYFKKEALQWSWEFLTSPLWLGLDPKLLACSVFAGDKDAPFDEEAYTLWRQIGMPEEKIAKLPKKNNWWGPAGQTGPCGPDSEIFYWTGDPEKVPTSFNDDNEYWVEIWNDVFMQYNKKEDGTYEKLAEQNVDTGMGLERISAIMQKQDDNFRTDLFWPIIEKIQEISAKQYDESQEIKRAMRIVSDHIKAAVFMAADGVEPSNVERGYIMRRLIRRAIRQAKMLGIEKPFTGQLVAIVQSIYGEHYCEVTKEGILILVVQEEEKFRSTLEKGLHEFERIIREGKIYTVSAQEAFRLFQSYGFPLEMVKELAEEKGISIDEEGFKEELKKHQALSRTASVGMFKGGLADNKEETKQLHTVAHLMLAGLRKVLDENVHQKGSNINAERLRFDFSYPDKMTQEQKQAVEEYVNEAISKKIPVVMKELSLEQAKATGAEGAFENKYGEVVKVYQIEGYSHEICGGPHVENTGEIKGIFKIKKEESSSAGVRRIKAVIE